VDGQKSGLCSRRRKGEAEGGSKGHLGKAIRRGPETPEKPLSTFDTGTQTIALEGVAEYNGRDRKSINVSRNGGEGGANRGGSPQRLVYNSGENIRGRNAEPKMPRRVNPRSPPGGRCCERKPMTKSLCLQKRGHLIKRQQKKGGEVTPRIRGRTT